MNRQPPNDAAVLRSPLGEPSAAAKRFLVEPDPYPADKYVAPSPELLAAAALAHERRQAELLREGGAS